MFWRRIFLAWKKSCLACAALAALALLGAQAEATEKPGALLQILEGEKAADKVIAVIDQEPLLLSELDLEARIVLISQGGIVAAQAVRLGNDVLRDMLAQVIDMRLVEKEANRLQAGSSSAEERQELYENFVARIGGLAAFNEFLVRHEVSEQRLMTVLDRTRRVEKFLADKVGVSASVPEANLREYYQAHADEFGDRPFEAVKKSVSERLVHKKLREETASFLESLRKRAEIRRLPPFAGSESAYLPNATVKMVTVTMEDVPDAGEKFE